MIRVIVTGGNDFRNYQLLERKLDTYIGNAKDSIEIITCRRQGCETLAKQYAKKHNIPYRDIDMHWKELDFPKGTQSKIDTLVRRCTAVIVFNNNEDVRTKMFLMSAVINKKKRKSIEYTRTETPLQQPVTPAQWKVIEKIENSPFNTAPKFTGRTAGEAGVYIRTWLR